MLNKKPSTPSTIFNLQPFSKGVMTDLARFIEYTILKPDTTLAEVRQLCEKAVQHNFAAVCIPPLYVRDAHRLLGEERKIRLATVVGFPMGYSAIAAKSEEIRRAIDDGADDVDTVVNIAAIRTGNWTHVEHDIDAIARATHMRGRTMKLILECGLLTADEIKRLCDMAHVARINWVKTGTGFHGYPATPEMVRQLRAAAHPSMKVKAAGGIRDIATAQSLIAAGADSIGTSALLI